MKFALAAERLLLAAGGVLSTVFLLTAADGFLGSRLALQTFAATKAPGPRPVQAGKYVDFALWSQKRIDAYQALLSQSFAPPVALLRIDRMGLEVPVFRGTGELQLNRGAGWIAGTGAPGQNGNMGIASHRDGFFRVLKDVQIGDTVSLSHAGTESQYEVDDIEIVGPTEVSVLRDRPLPNLTLVTCYPFYFAGDAPHRYVVHCSLKQRIPADSAVSASLGGKK
jgi:sortase A